MTIHVKHMIQYIEQINHGIVSAIKSTDFTTALDLDASRQEYLNELKGFEGPLSVEQLDQLKGVLHKVKSEIISIENAIHELNKNTGKHIRRLEGYR
jgi:hypothetical protein